jgi:hypothetical protein
MTAALTVTLTATPQMICDLFITAVEGGISYWCEELDLRKDGQPVSYQKAESFDGAWTAKLTMIEDDGTADITPEKLAQAFALRPNEAAALITENFAFDATAADNLIQCAAFGEIVYG